MGVKTKVFGKYAWLMFEGVARFYDEYMLRETRPLKRAEMMDMAREFFALIRFILPCVYCRLSYGEFIEREFNVQQMLLMKDGAKQLVYRLHNRVSKKLWDQEREKYADDPEELRALNRKWTHYCISYAQALRERFPAPTSYRFWHATIIFLGLILCDYRPKDARYIFRFFWVLARMWSRQAEEPLFAAFAAGLQHSAPLWKRADFADKLTLRLDAVWVLKTYVFDVRGWHFPHTRASFEARCRSAIVGCEPTKK